MVCFQFGFHLTWFRNTEETVKGSNCWAWPHGCFQVWLTIGETLTRRAVQMCEVLAATLVGDVVKFSHLSEEAVGECPFLLPGHVQERLGVAELCDFMVKFSVILGFEEKETGQSGQSSQKSLLIFGKDPTPAVLALLKRIGELAPECLGSLESSDEALTSPAQFGVSVCFTPIPAEKDWLQRLAKAMQAGLQGDDETSASKNLHL